MNDAAIDLQPFCEPASSDRTAFKMPFSIGEFTYATNGKIIVRVPRRDDVPERDDAPKNASKLFDENKCAGNFQPLPDFPKPTRETCLKCEGGGRCRCDTCGDEHSCGNCGGDGTVRGEIVKVKIGDQIVSNHWLALIAALPNPTIANALQKDHALTFRFDGGDGLLMPMWT